MTKEFKTCKIDLVAYDSLGHVVMEEKNIEAATYIISFEAPGEYKITFYNKDVNGTYSESRETAVHRLRVLLVWKGGEDIRQNVPQQRSPQGKDG
jgi:spore coat polysaccharide biosynthesis predicted glycosyltransferase SpsG